MALNLALVSGIEAVTNAILNTTSASLPLAQTLIAAPGVGKIVKLNSLYVANTTGGTLSAFVTLYHSSAPWIIVSGLVVNTLITTIVVTKDAPIYLVEAADSLLVYGSATGLTFTASYEILS